MTSGVLRSPSMKHASYSFVMRTQDALLQHVKRAVYQVGIWTSSTNTQQTLPSPRDCAWMKEPGTSTWVPVWMTIPEVSRACRELIKCCCKGACTTCKCTKSNLPYSPLCKCIKARLFTVTLVCVATVQSSLDVILGYYWMLLINPP